MLRKKCALWFVLVIGPPAETRMRPDHSHPAFSPDCKKLIFQSGHFTNGKRLNLMMVDLTKQAFWGK